MDFNEYEKKIIVSLGYDANDFDVSQLSDFLTNVYWDINTEQKLQELMLAVSYIKRLFQKICEKRNVQYDVNAVVDINAVLNDCKKEHDVLKDLDVSKLTDEKSFSEHLDVICAGFDYEQINDFASTFGFLYKAFHQYMVEHILPLLNNYIDYYFETKEPAPSDPFLDVIFNSDSSDEVLVWDEDWDETIFFDEIDSEMPTTFVQVEKKELSDEELVESLAFLNSIFDMVKVHSSFAHNGGLLTKKSNQKKLEEFYFDFGFIERFKAIMEHDRETHTYRFHGTTCLEDAISICEQGFGVMRDDLNSTSYKELTMDEVIIHQRGFGGEIGRDAYIIIDEPRGVQILERLQDNDELHLAGSGLQGLNVDAGNIVRSKYIVGYVDKKNREIVFNPNYYDYERFAAYANKKSV